ncbi:Bsp6I family type II restriction endonuclease [Polynucleobacter paneuropaeus]|nr:Bsp6I family type II restriction endonuclease [Polynucleobacter paneuropaeus]
MKLESKQIKLPEGSYLVNLQFFDSSDQAALKAIYERWVQLSNDLQKYGGRRINLPELLSEAVFCMNFSAGRMTQGIAGANSSFDCYDIHSKKEYRLKPVVSLKISLLLGQILFGMKSISSIFIQTVFMMELTIFTL